MWALKSKLGQTQSGPGLGPVSDPPVPLSVQLKDRRTHSALVNRTAWRGSWVAQSVERPTSAQVMISRFMGSCPASGSALTAQSLEPASDSVSPSLSATPMVTLCCSLTCSQK